MKNIWIALLGIIVLICLIMLVIQFENNSKKKDYLDIADDIFQSNFSQLCNNLNVQESEEVYEENEKCAYVCFTMFSLTSFSENEEMNKVVHILYDLSEKKALYDELERTSIDKLNKLSHNLQDNVLLKDVLEELSK